MPQPNLSHLAVFAAVARHCSFQRAAAEAGMSTSAVSHAIRGLEERLGVSLFNRTTRSVALTEAGQRLLERLQPALRDVGDALEEMNSFRATPAGTLRINTSRIAAHLLLAPLILPFLAAYPEIRLEIVEDDGLVDIVAGGFDAGIRFDEDVPEDMVGVRFGGPQRFAVVGSPGYFTRWPPPRHPPDLARHACIRHRFPSGRIFKWEFRQGSERFELEPAGPATLDMLGLGLRAALDGIGLAFLFEQLAAEAVADGRLVRVLDDWCPSYPGFMLYYPRQRRMPSALRAFIDMVRRPAL
ncbi:transcriptional regulator [Aliidongia dinghuensis]|uniref:Transcriptional regulator n=1 Tax=Aliidongia dinghuensis TaxID=1867774 RepID=A0A8J2YT99_9PROT|nr:LysR family transcriptional regulator [Aliidongia dinghuensis]GGF18178.1 transcriptional regulator [Aliidongia dinghuensis]